MLLSQRVTDQHMFPERVTDQHMFPERVTDQHMFPERVTDQQMFPECHCLASHGKPLKMFEHPAFSGSEKC